MKNKKNIIAIIAIMFFAFAFWPEKSSAECVQGWFIHNTEHQYPKGTNPIFGYFMEGDAALCPYLNQNLNRYQYYGCEQTRDEKCYRRCDDINGDGIPDSTYDSCYWTIWYDTGCQIDHGGIGCEYLLGKNTSPCVGMNCGTTLPPSPPSPPPIPCGVSLSANPITVTNPGGATVLTWVIDKFKPRPTSCQASSSPASAWTEAKSVAGGTSEPIYPASTTKYNIVCRGAGSYCFGDATVTVNYACGGCSKIYNHARVVYQSWKPDCAVSIPGTEVYSKWCPCEDGTMDHPDYDCSIPCAPICVSSECSAPCGGSYTRTCTGCGSDGTWDFPCPDCPTDEKSYYKEVAP